MLELRNIIKDYPAGGDTVHALKGIDLSFRACEFVSILGPSGCGKTTMLNIIGGLDGYTSGDLLINGRSTKDYKDRDWDTYRNHSIGFVFQSYNLIPHQTVLQNVELALTLSGVGKKERRRRATEALEQVGLGDQLNKRPSEMSGGQMQRVAIARALVNNPDIVLLDEPTGALDTETGIMVMEILKKVASDRLIIMVTHNPDLAERYSTRIVRMLDGRITDDTMPLTEEELEAERALAVEKAEQERRKKIPVMRYHTAFALSLKNLFTKKGRTALTGFAGSIGIIGIALIYAVSQGTENYIDEVQTDALTSYPLSITAETADTMTMLTGLAATKAEADLKLEEGTIAELNITAKVFEGVGSNDIRSFKAYLEGHYDEVAEDISAVRYGYGVTPLIYTRDLKGELLKCNPSDMMSSMMSSAMTSSTSIFSSYMSGLFNEMPEDLSLVEDQYTLVAGKWPTEWNEMVMVLTDETHITDFLEYGIGLKDAKELASMVDQIMKGEVTGVDTGSTVRYYTHDELLALDFRLVNASDLYRYNKEFSVWEDMSGSQEYMEQLVENGERLVISGIVCPASSSAATSGTLSPGVCYLPSLTLRVMREAADSELVKNQLLDTSVDAISGKTFEDLNAGNKDNGLNFDNMITVDAKKLSSAFGFEVDEDKVNAFVRDYLEEIAGNYSDEDTGPAERLFSETVAAMAKEMAEYYLANGDRKDLSDLGKEGWGVAVVLKTGDAEDIVDSYMGSDGARAHLSAMQAKYPLPENGYTTPISSLLNNALRTYVSNFDRNAFADCREQLQRKGITLNSTTALLNEAGCDEIARLASGSALASAVTSSMGGVMTQAQQYGDVEDAVGALTDRLIETMAGSIKVNKRKLASAFQFNMTEEELMRLMTAYSSYDSRERSADGNLRTLGYRSPDDPTSVMIYLTDFAAKEHFIQWLDEYNETQKARGREEWVIRYTDLTGVLMSSVKTIVDAIKYVLIAFVSISLIVSSIMIGVITLISVQERTKEIGILRAIGASKRNVSSMFNAETMIIGLLSGLMGVGTTYLMCVPINAILHNLTHISTLSAVLPVRVALALVAISMGLTLIAGIIPSGSAAKKDPVVALRTE